MKKIICFCLFLNTLLNQLHSEGPYIWGCVEMWCNLQGCFCKTEGYIQASSELDICSGETKSLFACIPGSCPERIYQWYEGYLKEVMPGIYQDYSGPVSGQTNNEFSIPEYNNPRSYWCEITYQSNTIVTDKVLVYWNSNVPSVQHDLSDEIVCRDDQVSLNFHVEGHNIYSWYVKPIGGSWTEISGQNNAWYIFTALIGDNNNQYKCIADNACWDNNQSSNVITLTVNNLPDINLGDDTHICEGETLNLDAGPDMIDYNWNTSNTSQILSVSNSGTYSVTVKDNNNCENSDEITVTVDPQLPPVDLNIDQQICLYDSVILDAGPGYNNYLWNTQQTEQSVIIKETGDYWVEVSNNNNVCRESDTIHVEVSKPYNKEKICVVTIDLNSGRNIIVWEKTPDVGIRAYKIYRESKIGVYEPIGEVDATDLSIFKDTTANPESQSYLYKITVIDSCSNESELATSQYHRPSFLQYVSSEGGIMLEWSDYSIQDMDDIGEYLTSYVIFRGTDSTGLEEYREVGSINTFTDTDPNAMQRRYYYRVAAILKDPCYPTIGKKSDSQLYEHSMSNIEDNQIPESPESDMYFLINPLVIYPNPFHKITTIQFPNPASARYKFILTDIFGKRIRYIDEITSDKLVLERGELPEGLYLIELRGPVIYRGKIIIE